MEKENKKKIKGRLWINLSLTTLALLGIALFTIAGINSTQGLIGLVVVLFGLHGLNTEKSNAIKIYLNED